MPKLPILSGYEIIKYLERLGFEKLRQKGSHVSMKKETQYGSIGCVIPLHKEVARGTLKSIIKQAHLSDEEFIEETFK